MYTSKLKIKNVFSERLKESLLMAGSLILSGNHAVPYHRADHRKSPSTITAETMAIGEARREDLGWQSEGVVWRRHWIQTGR